MERAVRRAAFILLLLSFGRVYGGEAPPPPEPVDPAAVAPAGEGSDDVDLGDVAGDAPTDEPETPAESEDNKKPVVVNGGYDVEYVQTFPDSITTKLSLGRSDLSLKLEEPGSGGRQVQLHSNPPMSFGISAGWKFLGGSVSFAASPGNEARGDSEVFDFQWTYYGRWLTFDVAFYDYSGFWYEDDATGNIELFDDLSVRGSAISAAYTFNNAKYSSAAVFKHTERQLKRAGSAKVLVSMSNVEVSTDSTMIPAAVAPLFTKFSNLRDISFFELAAGAGYGYTWLWRDKWYLHARAEGAAGINTFDVKATQGDDGTDFFFRGTFGASGGYHGKKYFTGLEAHVDTFNNSLDGGALEVTRTNLSIFGGMRF